MNNHISRRSRAVLRRSALALALSAGFAAGYVHAQSATGSIFGEAKAGASVTIENVDTGSKRSISADAAGRYRFPELPTGQYRISTDQGARNVSVKAGLGSEVNFAATNETLGTVTVTGNAVNPIDVSSVESSSVFTAKQLATLPVSRDVSNVALLAPGTVKGDPGFRGGNLASIGGASVAENGYYINGFDVTNIRKFISYATLPFDAISEEQVKTGGYGAEYGRSLGGVISVITKRGSNEFHAGGAVAWEPDALRLAQPNRLDKAAPGEYYRFTASDEDTELTYDAFASGPIIKDRLFFFTMLEGRRNATDGFGRDSSDHTVNSKPHGIVKLDFNLTDRHIFEFTGISNRDYAERRNYTNDTNGDGGTDLPYATRHLTPTSRYTTRNGGEVYIGKYTGYLTDTFTVSAQYGQLKSLSDDRDPRALPGAECPAAYDFRTGTLVHIGCWDENQFTVPDGAAPAARDRRRAGRADADWVLGSHHLRFGYDGEQFNSTNIGSTYSGGVYYRYYKVPASKKVNGVIVPAGTTEYVRVRHYFTQSGSYDIENTAKYLEDNWQVTDRLLLYAGLRGETFNNKNAQGVSFAKSDNLVAPRLGFSFDVHGDATTKLFGNAGRYYIPIASNTNIRASAAEGLYADFYTFSGIDPKTGAPVTLGTKLGNRLVTEPGLVPIPATVTSTTLKPMYQDEAILGIQQAFNDQWSGGARAIYRKIKNGMDDTCYHGPFAAWAADKGYKNFDPDSVPQCVIINPGKDATFALDLNNDGNLTKVTIPASYFKFPKYSRNYGALEFFIDKVWDDKFYMQASYTWSHSYGNSEGYVNSTLQQDDSGINQDFDFPSFEYGANGNLPNDRRHSLKVFGAARVAPGWMLSSNFLLQSGRPLNCYGFVPDTVPDFNPVGSFGGSGSYSSGSSFFCVDSTGKSVLVPRGTVGRTPWIYQLDMGLAWQPQLGNGNLTLKLDVFNLFNFQRALRLDETADRTRSAPEHNPNYLQVTDFQQPRYVRFTARYDF